MPLNSFSVGRDISLDITGPNGPLLFSQITSFHRKQDSTDQKIKSLDGVTRHLRFFDGWSGDFEIERQDPTIDRYFSQLEANYYQGLNELPVTITETITEVDGSISQFRYVQVLLKLEDAGTYKGDASVHMKVSFVAARRIQVV